MTRGYCAVCGTERPLRLALRKRSRRAPRRWYAMADCGACGFRFVHPIPSRAELESWYREHFAAYGPYVRAGELKREYFRARLDEIEAHVNPPGRMLDIGCAAGYLLDVAQQRGWDVHGVELNPECESALPPGLRDRVAFTTLEHAKFDAAFDLITLFDVLEHSPEPRCELEAVRRWLAPGGWVALQVPCIDSLGARIFGRFWYHYAPPAHLSYFSRDTLRRLAESLGFEVVEAFFVRKRFSAAYLWAQVSSAWLGGRGARMPLAPLARIRFPLPMGERLFLLRAR